MRDEADFAAYMAARWPFLVRTVALLGCTPEQAEQLVREGLVRCCEVWDKVRSDVDVDVYVYREVFDGWHRLGHQPWWRSVPAAGHRSGHAADAADDAADADDADDAAADM